MGETTPLELVELDQLNGERAVLQNAAKTELRLSRARWEELGRPNVLELQLVARP